MAESKPKTAPSLRTPGPKKRLGLSVPPALRLPHDDLIIAESTHDESEQKKTLPSHTSLSSVTSHTRQTSMTR